VSHTRTRTQKHAYIRIRVVDTHLRIRVYAHTRIRVYARIRRGLDEILQYVFTVHFYLLSGDAQRIPPKKLVSFGVDA
jgi:uncharacterized membrane protein